MSFYSYTAIDATGRQTSGILESGSADEASREIAGKGLYLLKIDETSATLQKIKTFLASHQVNRMEIIEFAQSLSVMLKAGMPILGCLEDLVSSTSNKVMKSAIRDIKKRVEHGSSVSTAIAAQGAIFPDIVKTLLSVGEETGRFDESLQEAADHLLRVQNLADAIKKALMYPIFAIFTTLSALIFWLAYVLPKLVGTMLGMGVKLPPLTLALIMVSALFQAHWGKMLFSLLLLPLIPYFMGKSRRARLLRDRLVIRIPIVRLIVFNRIMASFAEQFSILVAAGIGIDRLFTLLLPSLRNEYFAEKLSAAKASVLNGNTISDSLQEQGGFPNLVIRMINIGETSGTLENQLKFLSGYYTKKLNDATESLGKLIEPVVMIVIGGLFAVIIMGLMLPIYELVSKMLK